MTRYDDESASKQALQKQLRDLQTQLEEELNAEKNLGFDPAELKNLDPSQLVKPRDDDTYSPAHVEEDEKSESVATPAKKDSSS